MNIRRQFLLFLIAFLWIYQVHGGDETLFHRGDVEKKHPTKRNINHSHRRLRSKSDSFAKSSTSAKSANAAKSSNTAKSANSTKSSNTAKSEGATKSSNTAKSANSTKSSNTAKSLNSTKSSNTAKSEGATKSSSSAKSANVTRSSSTTRSASSTKSANAAKSSNTAKSSRTSKSSTTSLSNSNSYDQLTPTPTPTPIYYLTPTPTLSPSSIVSLYPTTQTPDDTYPSVSSTVSIQPSGDHSRFPSTRIICSNNDDTNSIISDVRYTYEIDVDEALDMQESIRMFQKKILDDISSSFGCHDESHRNLKYKIKQGGLSNKIYELRSPSLGGSIISNKCENYKRLNSTCTVVEGLVEIHHGSIFTRAAVFSKVSKMIRISGKAHNNANNEIRVTLLLGISVNEVSDDESPSSDSPLTMRVFPLVVVCTFCFSIIAIFVVRKGNQKYYIIGSEQSFSRSHPKGDEIFVPNEDERLSQHALVKKDLPLKLVDIEVYKPKIGHFSDEKYYLENTWSLLHTKRKHRRPLSTIDECDSEGSLRLDENEKRSKSTKTQGTQSDLTYDRIYDKCFFSSRRIVDSDSSAFVCIDMFADDECQR